MKKIAFINQRYGLEVNGGSELYTRQVAEHLTSFYDVHIITTCAIDHLTWSNYYKPGEEVINNVTVHRFKTDMNRAQNFPEINQQLMKDPKSIDLQNKWIDAQGPVSYDAIKYIKEHEHEYDMFIFVTYLYYLTVRGLKKVKDKSIFIPTAHDEPYIYLDIYNPVFTSPKGIIYLTDEEKKLVQNIFHNENIINKVIGIGIDIPKNIDQNKFRNKYNLYDNYIIYIGRIEGGKGCDNLFQYFINYKKRNINNLKLILLGKSAMEIPNHKDIIHLGFVSDEDKFNGIAGAKALILPSQFESLSIAVLESMACKIPVVVNGKCEVLKGHCKKSNAGLYYDNFLEFEGILNYILNNPTQTKIMGENGLKYVDEYYRWNIIVKELQDIINKILSCK